MSGDHLARAALYSAFLSTLTVLAARLPVDAVLATRAALLNDCATPYFESASPRKRRFNRPLIEAGMVDLA